MGDLARKLLLKPGMRAAFLNAPDGYRDTLGELPAGASEAVEGEGGLDFVQVFVRDAAELEEWAPRATAAVKRDGLLWFCYPKGGKKAGTNINRDILWKLLGERHGLAGVAMVAIDDKWSAFRARPAELVGK
ncbi:MAG TPA: hypothetical protein VNT60_10540 [Deinococcales bacterium]|nr:hypothetical protein [Deinococcales bacterium]